MHWDEHRNIFFSDAFVVPKINEFILEENRFRVGNLTAKQKEIIEKLENLLENIDEVMSAKYRFANSNFL